MSILTSGIAAVGIAAVGIAAVGIAAVGIAAVGIAAVGNRISLDARIGGVTDFANVYGFDAMNRVIRID